MKLLLDTHTFLWFIDDNPRLGSHARELLEDSDNELFFSTASAWEMAIKIGLGKLTLAPSFGDFLPEQLAQNGVALLPIEIVHLAYLTRLPPHHRDPFDRLIAAQSLAENLPVVSVDSAFDSYKVQRLW